MLFAAAGAGIVGAGLGATGGVAWARPAEAPSAGPSSPASGDHREFVLLPIDELLASYPTFFTELRQAEHVDDTAWVGVLRIACAAHDGHKAATAKVTRALQRLVHARSDVPGTVVRAVQLLTDR